MTKEEFKRTGFRTGQNVLINYKTMGNTKPIFTRTRFTILDIIETESDIILRGNNIGFLVSKIVEISR